MPESGDSFARDKSTSSDVVVSFFGGRPRLRLMVGGELENEVCGGRDEDVVGSVLENGESGRCI